MKLSEYQIQAIEKMSRRALKSEIERIRYLIANYKFSKKELKFENEMLSVLEKEYDRKAPKKEAKEANL